MRLTPRGGRQNSSLAPLAAGDVRDALPRPEPARPPRGRPVHHVEIISSEVSRSAEFYEKLFGWEHSPTTTSEHPVFETGSVTGGYMGLAAAVPLVQAGLRPGDILLCVPSADLEQDLADVGRLGGVALVQPMIVGNCRIALFTDPTGARVLLIEESWEMGMPTR